MRGRKIVGWVTLLGLLAAVAIIWVQRHAIYDWARLRGYQPSNAVVTLANDTTMTSPARHLFYVNRPAIEDKADFNNSCPNNGGEQTIILGCYHGGEAGIFLYAVSDPKLSGVEQVTAAHEMLHGAYERLSSKDRAYVGGLLQNYYKHDLHDKRLLDTIAAYKKSEPNDVVNEMHSVFGTEVANLPASLETYYKRYFTNRHQIVAYAQHYQQTFTGRQAQAATLLAQIKAIEAQLSISKTQIDNMEANLQVQQQRLQSDRHNSSAATYNAEVDDYNSSVQKYRNLINTYNQLIISHNELVVHYQALVVETNQLFQELNSRAPSVKSQ